jgi:N-acetylglucosamine-6-phosphate deacetylase
MRSDPGRRLVVQADRLMLPDGMRGPGFVVLENGRIAGLGEGRHARPDLDAEGQTLAPGFVDLQINGAAGCDFLAPTEAGLEAAHAHLLRTGTVAYLPTLISAPEDRLRHALAFFAERVRRQTAPRILGVHLEGPFLSPIRPGAHRPEHLRPPSVDWIAGLIEEFPGVVRLVTLAPELDGAAQVIEYLVSRGIAVAAGHTDATYAEAMAAFERGVRLATHLFNAMRPYHHREPGIVGAALGHPGVACSIIADGVHLHPAVVEHVLAVKGPERTILVTDATSAAGASPPEVTLGGRTVRVADGAPRLADGTLAGSLLTMDQAVRNVAGARGLDRAIHLAAAGGLDRAIRVASAAPSRLLGLDQGELRPGCGADLVLLDHDLRVTAAVVGGSVAFGSNA